MDAFDPTPKPYHGEAHTYMTMNAHHMFPAVTKYEGSKDPIEKSFLSLVHAIDTNLPGHFTPDDYENIEKAYLFGKEKHSEQKRKSGEPYILHPLEVAKILTSLKVDSASIIAAVLHDTVEDTNTTLAEIKREFGEAVADLVDGLTKIGKIKFRSSQEKLAENFRKMIIATAKDLRVIIIKLCDRLHNMRTLDHLPPEKRQRIAQETIEIYAPLANRLGIYGIKSELEDLCLKHTKNEVYKGIKAKVDAKKDERQRFIGEIIEILERELKKFGFKNAKVTGRPKHFYSIYKKMKDRMLDFEDIHDLFAFRVIVDSIKDCYEVLGIVHAMWKPMPGRFKDYIAMPKANLYQSLHTTVIRPNGEPIEIQIRTHEMHSTSEYGIAAHWNYKEGGKSISDVKTMKNFSWLRQIMEMQSEIQDSNEFLESVKVDLFEDEIFVFTPKGDVIQLPQKSTALDFAFAIHTNLGLTTISAKVNNKMVPLKKRLKSGDIIEITTSKTQKPSKEWLNFATTSKARHKIRSFLRSEQRENSRKIGMELLQQALSSIDLDLNKIKKHGLVEKVVKATKESSIDDVYIAIGYGKVHAKDLIRKSFPKEFIEQKNLRDEISEPQPIEDKEVKTRPSNYRGIEVSGLEDVLINIAKCCLPLPGDPVIGFITRGEGVSIHHQNCKMAELLDPRRKVDVTWHQQKSSQFHSVFLKVITKDEPGVLAEVTSAISNAGANIKNAAVKISSHNLGILDFHIAVRSNEHLGQIIANVERIPTVISAQRKSKAQ